MSRLTSHESRIVPVVAEELTVQKQLKEIGRVRLHKTVRERQDIVDDSVLREEVLVERVAINHIVERLPPTVRQEGDTLIVPVLEVVLVAEKRLMLKEELLARRCQQPGRSIPLLLRGLTSRLCTAPAKANRFHV